MAVASVYGANFEVNNLRFRDDTAVQAAKALAVEINKGVLSGAVTPERNNRSPTVSSGVHEYVRTRPGFVNLPDGYGATVIRATDVTVGGSASTDQSVIGGSGKITYANTHHAASGTLVFGDGSDLVSLSGANHGNWHLTLGDGNDTVFAHNTGHDTIAAGNGNDFISLGRGQYDVKLSDGNTTVSGNAAGRPYLDYLHHRTPFLSGVSNFEAGGSNVTLGGGKSHTTTLDLVNGVTSGAHDVIKDFAGGVTLNLSGYDPHQVNYAITHPKVHGNQISITLEDHTKLTFDSATFRASKFSVT
jgi:Ca2+-binding RTX toxin-like protein